MENVKRLTCIAVLALAATAWATDMMPPAWRGEAGTTYQVWDFDTAADVVDPNASTNPYGMSQALVEAGEFGSGWLNQELGGPLSGYWDIGEGSIFLGVPMSTDPGAFVDVSIQVTYYQAITQPPMMEVLGVDGQFVSSQTALLQADPPLGGWYVQQSLWRIQGADMLVVLTGDPMWGAVVDQVIIDTMVPEPTSICLTGLMAAGLLLRRGRA